jgi:hypothetical protein
MQNVAETHETVPSQPAGESTRTGAENVIADQTVPDDAAVLRPPGPVTVRVRLYFWLLAPDSAGSVTPKLTRPGVEPAEQAFVTGRPATAGVTDSVHFADRVTAADRTVVPPADGKSAGLAATCVMAGGASRTATVTGLAVALPPRPVTVSPNLYDFWAAAELAGSRTARLADPRPQGTFAGNPATFGDTLNAHSLAFLTAALRRKVPPLEGSALALARK